MSEPNTEWDNVPASRVLPAWREQVRKLSLEINELWDKNQTLKSEVERLQSELQMEKENEDRLMREWQKANNEIYNLQTKVVALVDDQTRLKADVERLTKAGNQLWAFAHNCVVRGVYPKIAQERINIWNAAKEGKDAQ